eukprot:1098431-Amphidinium_carterae.1
MSKEIASLEKGVVGGVVDDHIWASAPRLVAPSLPILTDTRGQVSPRIMELLELSSHTKKLWHQQ